MGSIWGHGSLPCHNVGKNGLQDQTQSHSEEEEKASESERENGMAEFYNSAVSELAVSVDLDLLLAWNPVMVDTLAC